MYKVKGLFEVEQKKNKTTQVVQLLVKVIKKFIDLNWCWVVVTKNTHVFITGKNKHL